MAVGLADGTVQVQDEFGELAVAVSRIDPRTGEIHQVLEVLLGAEGFGLEAGHLTGGGCGLIVGPTTDHDPQRGIEAETLSIIDILVASSRL